MNVTDIRTAVVREVLELHGGVVVSDDRHHTNIDVFSHTFALGYGQTRRVCIRTEVSDEAITVIIILDDREDDELVSGGGLRRGDSVSFMDPDLLRKYDAVLKRTIPLWLPWMPNLVRLKELLGRERVETYGC